MFLATMKNDTTKEAEIGKEININILTGIGNVMMASSKDAKITEDGEKSAVDREKVYVMVYALSLPMDKLNRKQTSN